MCLGMWGVHTCTQAHTFTCFWVVTATPVSSSKALLLVVMRQGLSLNLETADSPGLAYQGTLELPPSALPHRGYSMSGAGVHSSYQGSGESKCSSFKLAQKSLCRLSQLPSSKAGLWLALLPEGCPRRAGGSPAVCVLAQLLEALGHFL